MKSYFIYRRATTITARKVVFTVLVLTQHETWDEFISNMGHSDLDMNLVFRWDVNKCDEGGYYMEIFIVHQRKGRFVPFFIKCVEDKDLHSILEFLKKRKSHLKNLWEGI